MDVKSGTGRHSGAHNTPAVGEVSVAALTGPQDEPADVAMTLVAREEPFQLASGPTIDGYTLNHTSPGPDIRAIEGQLIEVRLVNESVPDGVTLHWHGVDVPNAEDGVAGVTQDAGRHDERAEKALAHLLVRDLVRVVPERPGMVGHKPVDVLLADPDGGSAGLGSTDVVDVPAHVHTYEGQRTIGGQVGERRVDVEPGSLVRVRVVNTDDGPLRSWVTGSAYRVVAIDGYDLHAPTPVSDTTVQVTAGGRVDLELTTPTDGSAVRVAGETYEIAFLADHPGIWKDHCHNLPHAAEGLVAHLAHSGVTEPFVVGGPASNQPE